jgi:hypothetical protein
MTNYTCIGSYCVSSTYVSIWENKNAKSRWAIKLDDTTNNCISTKYFTEEKDALLYYDKEIKKTKNK